MAETLLQELKRYVHWTPEDEAALRALRPHALPHLQRISEVFYARILEHEAARKVLQSESQVGRLKVTLVAWMDKFKANRDAVKALGEARLGRDPESFCRMWEYHYLACAGGFRSRCISVHQYVLSPNGIAGGMAAVRS